MRQRSYEGVRGCIGESVATTEPRFDAESHPRSGPSGYEAATTLQDHAEPENRSHLFEDSDVQYEVGTELGSHQPQRYLGGCMSQVAICYRLVGVC
jgi:hypothetical protein